MPADPRLPARLRELRNERGLSFRKLGRLVNYSHVYLWQIETGDRPAPPDVIRRLDAELGAGGELVKLANGVLTDDDTQDRLAAVAAQPRRVDPATLDALTAVLATYRRLEDTIGPAAVWAPVRAQLDLVETILASASGRIQRTALDVAAQQAQFAGALTLATGRRGAPTLFRRAERMAEQAGDIQMQATARSYVGYAAERASRPAEVIAASQAVRSLSGVYVGQVAFSVGQEARGHALRGDAHAVRELLAEHRDLAAETAAWTGPVPPWHYYRTPAFFRLERGLTLALLARCDGGRHAVAAVDELRAGVAGMPADQRDAEWLADPFLLTLAETQNQLGDTAGAAETVTHIQRIAAATGAPQLAQRVARLAPR